MQPVRSGDSYFSSPKCGTFWPLVTSVDSYTIEVSMRRQTRLSDLLADRRRTQRYSCSGHVRIASLPLSGNLLSGTIRDLGLGGCCIENIETSSPFDLGDRTEILVKVNSWFFRALAHVKAVHDRSGISLEFLRMSAGASSMLRDLIADLGRPRPWATSQKRDAPRPISWNSNPVAELNQCRALVGTIVPAESAETALAANRQSWDRYLHPKATAIDLFA